MRSTGRAGTILLEPEFNFGSELPRHSAGDPARAGVNFAREDGQNITNAVVEAGGRVSPLRRSNARNPHFLLAGVYGDLVYHHGAGSRRTSFWTSADEEADDAARIALRDAAFDDPDGLLDFLTGEGAPSEEGPLVALSGSARPLHR